MSKKEVRTHPAVDSPHKIASIADPATIPENEPCVEKQGSLTYPFCWPWSFAVVCVGCGPGGGQNNFFTVTAAQQFLYKAENALVQNQHGNRTHCPLQGLGRWREAPAVPRGHPQGCSFVNYGITVHPVSSVTFAFAARIPQA